MTCPTFEYFLLEKGYPFVLERDTTYRVNQDYRGPLEEINGQLARVLAGEKPVDIIDATHTLYPLYYYLVRAGTLTCEKIPLLPSSLLGGNTITSQFIRWRLEHGI